MWWEQEFTSDAERTQWNWVPFQSVGPLQFGQTVYEVAAVLVSLLVDGVQILSGRLSLKWE